MNRKKIIAIYTRVSTDEYCNKSCERSIENLNDNYELMLSENPVYNWLEENIEKISFKLLKGFITNLVPLGKAGENYFNDLVSNRSVMKEELMNQYYKYQTKYNEGMLKVNSYSELVKKGYTGVVMFGLCPVDDVIRN